MVGASPPSRSRSRSPVPCSTDPAPRKSTVLNAAWLTARSSAAVRATSATPRLAGAVQQQRDGHRGEDQADVLGGRVGEQDLEVAGHRGLQDPVQRGANASASSRTAHQLGPAGQQAQQDQQHPVDAHLHHRGAHRRRHVAGGLGVRPRQPDVQRHQAGLRGEPGQEEHERRARRAPGHPGAGDRAERGAAADRHQDGEPGQQQQEAQVGHHGVPQRWRGPRRGAGGGRPAPGSSSRWPSAPTPGGTRPRRRRRAPAACPGRRPRTPPSRTVRRPPPRRSRSRRGLSGPPPIRPGAGTRRRARRGPAASDPAGCSAAGRSGPAARPGTGTRHRRGAGHGPGDPECRGRAAGHPGARAVRGEQAPRARPGRRARAARSGPPGRRSSAGHPPQRGHDRLRLRWAPGDGEVDRHHLVDRPDHPVAVGEHAAGRGRSPRRRPRPGAGASPRPSGAAARACCGSRPRSPAARRRAAARPPAGRRSGRRRTPGRTPRPPRSRTRCTTRSRRGGPGRCRPACARGGTRRAGQARGRGGRLGDATDPADQPGQAKGAHRSAALPGRMGVEVTASGRPTCGSAGLPGPARAPARPDRPGPHAARAWPPTSRSRVCGDHDRVDDLAAQALLADQPRAAQDGQLLGQAAGLRRDLDQELMDGVVPFAEQLQHADPYRVPQRPEQVGLRLVQGHRHDPPTFEDEQLKESASPAP